MNLNMLVEHSDTAASKKKFECGPRHSLFSSVALLCKHWKLLRVVFLYWKKQSAGEMVGASQPSFVTFVLFSPQRKSVTSIYNACPWIAFSWNPKSNGWEWRDGFHPTLTCTEHWCSTAHYTFQSRKRQRVRRSLSLPSTLLHTVARDYCNDMLHLGHKL